MVKKRFLQSISVCALCFCMIFVTLSLQTPAYAEDDRELRINQLMEQRAEAICADDVERIAEIDEQLANLDVVDLSTEEVMEIFADNDSSERWLTPPDSPNVDWKSFQSTVISNGKTYETQTLLAQPKNELSNLRIDRRNEVDTSLQWKAGAMNAVQVLVSASVAKVTGKDLIVTMYDTLKGFITGLTKETEFIGAAAQYTCETIETVSLIYVRKKGQSGNQALTLSHLSSTCLTSIGYQCNKMRFVNGTAVPDIDQKKWKLTSTPDGYNSATRAVTSFQKSITTRSFVENVEIRGLEKKIVTNIFPITPEGPAHIM